MQRTGPARHRGRAAPWWLVPGDAWGIPAGLTNAAGLFRYTNTPLKPPVLHKSNTISGERRGPLPGERPARRGAAAARLAPRPTDAASESIRRTTIGNRLIGRFPSTGRFFIKRGQHAGVAPGSAQRSGGDREPSGAPLRESCHRARPRAAAPARTPDLMPAQDRPQPLLPRQPEAGGDVRAAPRRGRYLSLLSVRPVAPLSFPPRDLAARPGLRVSPRGGRRRRGRAGALCGRGEAPRSPRAARRPLSRARTPRGGAGGGAAPREGPEFEKVPVAGGTARSNGGADPAGERRARGSQGSRRGEPSRASGEGGPPLRGCPLRSAFPRGNRSSLTRRQPPAPGRGRRSAGRGASRCPVACGRGRAPARWERLRSRWGPLKVSPSAQGSGIRAEFVPAAEMPARHGAGAGGEAAAGAAAAEGSQPPRGEKRPFWKELPGASEAPCPGGVSGGSGDGEPGTESGLCPPGASRAGSLASPCAARPGKGNCLQAPPQLPFLRTFACGKSERDCPEPVRRRPPPAAQGARGGRCDSGCPGEQAWSPAGR